VLTVEGTVLTAATSPGTIAHLPVGGPVRCHCGATGCLEASLGTGRGSGRAGLVGQKSIAAVIEAGRAVRRTSCPPNAPGCSAAGWRWSATCSARTTWCCSAPAFTGYRPALAQLSASFTAASVLAP
jgi:hypothetical protein